MEPSFCFWGLILGASLLAAVTPPASDLFEVDVHELAAVWEREHISPADPYSLHYADLQTHLRVLTEKFPEQIRLETVGKSAEGRDIGMATLGAGPEKILFWSQMHGDEPTATNSVLDLIHFLATHRSDAWVVQILQRYTLLFVPMLNPDGAERNQRRNAQAIDINRDARLLQTPEGRILKDLRDIHKPILGFNLHNQNSQTTVGDTGRVATVALLAVAADIPERFRKPGAGLDAVPPAVMLAKRTTAVLYEALSPFAYGHISRYDEEFNPRAFGDNLTLWGTPIVLIESGGLPGGRPANFTVQLNFIGVLAALNSLASGKIQNANPAVFDALKLNSDNPIFDLLLQNAWIFTGNNVPLSRGDIGIRRDMRAGSQGKAIIADIGDLGVFTAHQIMDCTDTLVAPGLIAWDPKAAVFSEDGRQSEYLKRGVTTLLRTADIRELRGKEPRSIEWERTPGLLNWSFLVTGDLSFNTPQEQLLLSKWLSSGARGWIHPKPTTAQAEQIPSWFGVERLDPAGAAALQLSPVLEGEPSRELPRWTTEAAKKLHLSGRGIIEPGAVADLSIWKTPSSPPTNLRELSLWRVIINGLEIDPSHPAAAGAFLGRK